jgi:pimeloyl-ACP methyl ester carboxylesterase
MSQNSADQRQETLMSASFLDRLSARVLFAVTPEYADVRAARGDEYGQTPTFRSPPPMPIAYETIAGVRIRYAHQRDSEGMPTLILFNPLPQSILAFSPIWSHLASNFEVYACDLPGFGGSEGGEEYMTFEAQGRFVHEFISYFGIQKPHLLGPDVGMAAALAYVTNFPNDVASLAIGDGPGVLPSRNGSVINKMVESRFWRLVFRVAGAGTFVHAANELCYVNYVPNEEEISDYIGSYSGRIGPVTLWFKWYPKSLQYVDAKLREIDLPVLVFWGAEDQLLLSENAAELGDRLPRSKVHVLEDCGHFAYQDQHEAFSMLISEWVASDHKSL